MKKLLFACTALAIQLTGLNACGTAPQKKESQRSEGATEIVIARVDKKSTQDGGSTIAFSTSNQQTRSISDASAAETAFLTGQKIAFENKLGDAPVTPVTEVPADASKPPVYTPVYTPGNAPVEPYPPVVQHPGQNGPCADPCKPVVQHPGQNGHCVDPCRPVACGCGWDFPIFRAAGRLAWAAGSLVFWWGNAVSVNINQIDYNDHYNDYNGYQGEHHKPNYGHPTPVQTPVQKTFAGDSYMKQYTPSFKGDSGKPVDYSFSHTVESADAFFYIYSR